VDTYSGYILASTHTGEVTMHIITHCLALFIAMGKPQKLRTDNGPAYTSTAFQRFCEAYQIHPTTRIPCNPPEQAIVECAHATFKIQLKKLKGGDEVLPPGSQLHEILYTLNFFYCPEYSLTPTERHWQPQGLTGRPPVLWENVLTGKFHGPTPVLMGGQGHLCGFPEDAELPVWEPSQFVKPHGPHGPKIRRLRLEYWPQEREPLRLTPLLTRGRPRK
jgi:hypothetical protein